MTSEKTKRGVLKNLITGGLSSAIARSFMNPLERVEILRQTSNVDYKNLSILSSFIEMIKTEGINGLFKGNTASIIRVFPFSAIEFYTLELAKNVLRKCNISTQNFFGLFLCGTFSGWVAVTATFPLDVVRTRLAVTTKNSSIKEKKIIESLLMLYNDNGIRGLYKGYGFSSVGNILFIASKQSIFEFLKNNFPLKRYKNSANLIYGFTAGVIGTIFLYPNYVLKRVAQTCKMIINNNYKSIAKGNFSLAKYIREIYHQKGIFGFYSGLSLNLVKSGPYFALTFLCNEKLKEVLKF